MGAQQNNSSAVYQSILKSLTKPLKIKKYIKKPKAYKNKKRHKNTKHFDLNARH
jgi:hypothetical protein